MAATNKTIPTAAEAYFAAQPEARAADCKRLADVDLGVLEQFCVAALREKRS